MKNFKFDLPDYIGDVIMDTLIEYLAKDYTVSYKVKGETVTRTLNLLELGWAPGLRNTTRVLGSARRVGGDKTIFISKWISISQLFDTILHEIAHGIDYEIRNTSDHGPIWQSIARQIGARPQAKQKIPNNSANITKKPTYFIACPNCEWVVPKYTNKPMGVADKGCVTCRGDIVRVDLNGKIFESDKVGV